MSNSNFIRRQLGYRLRSLRDAAGLSRRAVQMAEVIRSTRILKALEDGYSTTVTYPTINALCRLYGTSYAMRKETERMFRSVTSDEWRETPESNWYNETALLIQAERLAWSMHIYEPNNLVGLLQTEAYMERRLRASTTSSQLAALIRKRLERQVDVWKYGKCRQALMIMTQSAVRDVTEPEQLDMIRQFAADERVTIRVQDDGEVLDLSYRYPFTILGFEQPAEACVYTETVSAHRYESQPAAVTAYLAFFETIFHKAIPIEEFFHAHVNLA